MNGEWFVVLCSLRKDAPTPPESEPQRRKGGARGARKEDI